MQTSFEQLILFYIETLPFLLWLASGKWWQATGSVVHPAPIPVSLVACHLLCLRYIRNGWDLEYHLVLLSHTKYHLVTPSIT